MIYKSPKPSRNVRAKYNKLYTKNKKVLVMEIPGDPILNTAKIIKRNTQSKKNSYLDIGCGEGVHMVHISKIGFECTGIDLSEIAIKKAKALAIKYKCKPKLICGNFLKVEFDQNFDLVVSNFTLHHIKEDYKRKFIEKMMMYTNDNGYNIIISHRFYRNGRKIEGFATKLEEFYIKKGWIVKKHKEGHSGRNYIGLKNYWECIIAQKSSKAKF
jgi:2-polyprenyl-3-methyl-5-hydroxy-6-metoxy-1,4-benzoquinol methylase